MEKKVSNYLLSVINLYDDLASYLKSNSNLRLLKTPNLYRVKLNTRLINPEKKKANDFEEHLKYFDYVIQHNFPKEILNNYLVNVEDLSAYGVCFQLGQFLNVDEYAGRYSTRHNLIVVDINDKQQILSIFHEFFHMASTNRMNPEKIKTGFCFNNSQTNNFMGRKLNEGYTDLITSRYFGHVGYTPGYPLAVKYVSVLEQIVGKEKMENLYLTANPGGLAAELQKYDSTDSILHFIDELDHIDPLNDFAPVDQIRLSNITYYLVSWYTRKIVSNGANIFDQKIKNHILAFAYQLPSRIPKPNSDNRYFAIDIDKIVNEVIDDTINRIPRITPGR